MKLLRKTIPMTLSLAIVFMFAACGGDKAPATDTQASTAGSADTIAVSSVTIEGTGISSNAVSITIGQTIQLSAKVQPENAADKTVNWSSSDPEVASVTEGLLKGLKAGTAKILAVASTDSVASTALEVTVTDAAVFNGVTAGQLDSIPKEVDLKKWDIAWGPTPTNVFFNLTGEPAATDVIWRGGKTEKSAFADAAWGLILNTLEDQEDEIPGAFIYNKTDVAAGMKKLQVIARCNTGDPALSERGAFRVQAAYKENGQYVVAPLKVEFSEDQLAQKDAALTQTADGWITFEVPPTIDKCDSFFFDVAALAGKQDVVFLIEANDRMDQKGPDGTNLADRVIVLAVKLTDE